ncbi:acyltransferase family protein [Alkaliphilus peptidifermentans]|uniref:Surface polysaccharide O-acyltransferase, integral membrane enzyme n=1 Tax=Alkaliphilus peptidifermentans DSM 18978 TaxID=1120976 RepID=A0A1G5KXX7_9FIRM|nr:acyltransferase family protein [Alkaliphilus peptidifermentans]SCZ05437.1 Surface polysaccharide O-acyltransferase, integral membrane enzyme [Alkaliphilus peptidifermentans DSM 18978]
MRKYYIDNLRSLGILLLIPYHTFMIYNGFELFYIHGGKTVRLANDFIFLTAIWFMPLLFLISGMSTYYSIQKRNSKMYIMERFYKIFIPLIFGILFIVPIQTFYAEKYHNNYQGSYIHQYRLFFTKETDLTGYLGGFTPAHLWFLLYLFIISILALPVIKKLMKVDFREINWFNRKDRIILLFIVPFLFSAILDISGKSLGQFFTIFMLGFILAKDEEMLVTIEKNRLMYFIITITTSLCLYLFYYRFGGLYGFSLKAISYSAFRHLIMWVSLLTILGYGIKFLNNANRFSNYFTKSAFSFYIFHQSWLILIAYYVFKWTNIILLRMVLIILVTFILSLLTYELFRRIAVTRYMFGIKR